MSTLTVSNIQLNQEGNAAISIANSYNVVISVDGTEKAKFDSTGAIFSNITTGNITTGNINSDNITTGNIIAGNITSTSGNITANNITADFIDVNRISVTDVSLNRNLLINPSFRISQRRSAIDGSINYSTSGSSNVFATDCWKTYDSSSGTLALSRTLVPTQNTINSSIYSINVSVTTADSSLGTTEYAMPFVTFVEAQDIFQELQWGTTDAKEATLSFWFRSSIANTYSVILRTGSSFLGATSGVSTWGTTFDVLEQNKWEFKQFVIPARTSPTLGDTQRYTNDYFLVIGGLTGNNSQKVTAANSNTWITSTNLLLSHVNANNWFANLQAKMYLALPQLEKGNVANPVFDYRPYEQEFLKCQRYFEIYVSDYGAAGTLTSNTPMSPIGMVAAGTNNRLRVPIFFRTRKADTPTLEIDTFSGTYDGNTGIRIISSTPRDANASPILHAADTYSALVDFTAGASIGSAPGYVSANVDANVAAAYPWFGFKSSPI